MSKSGNGNRKPLDREVPLVAVKPALDPGEWRAVLASTERLDQVRGAFANGPFTTHALAAILLYGEPYGFSQQDVKDETEVATYCAKMAGDHMSLGDTATAETFRLLGERHRERAAKIAALLPPDEASAAT